MRNLYPIKDDIVLIFLKEIVYFMCVSLHQHYFLCTMCAGALESLEEAVSALLNLELDSYESLPGCWPPNTGHLQG